MQTRRMIVALMASIAVFYVWTIVARYIFPRPVATTQPVATSPATNIADDAATQPEQAPTTGTITASATRPAGYDIRGGQDATPVQLGDVVKGNPYPMALEITPRGAAVASARIRGHYETVQKKEPYQILEPVTPRNGHKEHGDFYSFGTRIRFENLKLDVPLDEVLWLLSPESTENRKVFTVQVNTSNGEPLARITKTYDLQPQPPKPKQQTYDLGLSLTVENLTQQPLRAILVQLGPVGFRQEDERAEDRKVVSGVWRDGKIVVKGHARTEIYEKYKVELGADQDSTRIAWAAETNKYFTCIMAPTGRTSPNDPIRFAKVEAIDLTEAAKGDVPKVSALTYQYITTARNIPAGGSEQVDFDCFIGPKSRTSFQDVKKYAALDYYGVIRESFYACAPSALVTLMMKLLDFFYTIPPHNYGVAIIILVLVVRAILHPITKRSQVNMMRMQKQMSVLQPKLEAIKQKYANDRVKMNQSIMELYRDAGINPAGNVLTCLPLLLQIPIWGALWTALSSTVEMRHAPFDGWWIKNLAGQDAVIVFSNPIHIPLLGSLMGGAITSLNILPILLGISQLLQAKYMPHAKPAARTESNSNVPDQMEQQRKMMMFMSVFFVLLLYNAPSGLNLYIMASNFFGILEQWRIRKHIADEEKKFAEQAAAAPAGARGGESTAPKKLTWMQRKWLELQKQAEEAKKLESQRDKKPKSRK